MKNHNFDAAVIFLAMLIAIGALIASYYFGAQVNTDPNLITNSVSPSPLALVETPTASPSSSASLSAVAKASPVPKNWKTYTSKEFKFKISYPPSLIASVSGESHIDFVTAADKAAIVQFNTDVQAFNFPQLWNAPDNSIIRSDNPDAKGVDVKIANHMADGLEAVEYSFTDTIEGKQRSTRGYIIDRKDYQFHLFGDVSNSNLLSQMLSSFKNL